MSSSPYLTQLTSRTPLVSQRTPSLPSFALYHFLPFLSPPFPSSLSPDFSLFPPDSRQALSRLLAFTMEPKSAEIRRSSQKTVTGLFELNPATLTLMLPSVPKPLQESANKILKGYMQVCVYIFSCRHV